MLPNDELMRFFNASNPANTLDMANPRDRQYYIDVSAVRDGETIQEIYKTIRWSNGTTCQLFTGHLGCGKSTELLRLKMYLEQYGFHVVYFDSSKDLDMNDVDLSDILLAIARRVSESFDQASIRLSSHRFRQIFQEIMDFLNTPIDVTMKTEVVLGIAKITAQAKESPRVRNQLRDFLEPRTRNLLEAINQDLLLPAHERLCQHNKQGLVVIVDTLERLDTRIMPSGQTQPEYLFIERGAQLGRLHCHMVYTIPLILSESLRSEELINRLGHPKLLPMIPVQLRDGRPFHEGLALLQQIVLTRAFPELSSAQRLEKVTDVFEDRETLDRLCQISGGHVRNLLNLLFRCLQMHDLPITRLTLEQAIAEKLGRLRMAISEQHWAVLRQVAQQKWLVLTEPAHQVLLSKTLVFEYRDRQGRWFDINPVLAEAPEMKS